MHRFRCVGLLALLLSAPHLEARQEIDLSTASDVFTLVGAAVWDRTGGRITSCDANGDGIEDLLLGADLADGPTGTRFDAGEAWLVLGGRRRWIGTIGIAQAATTRILGPDMFDDLGLAVACGDLNGDGFDDLVLGADSADGPDNNAPSTGEVHIVFGRAAWPPLIDLQTGGSTVVYGETRDDLAGSKVTVGDLNGDGTVDLVIGAQRAENAAGTGDSGRAYVLFGRSQWPATLLLYDVADVELLGADDLDRFGARHAIADVDSDGTSDLVVGVFAGDGPNNTRPDAGEAAIFRGRSLWPSSIDLATEAPDTRIWGVDDRDGYADIVALTVADPTGDGRPRLFLGARYGDGPNEMRFDSGEYRSVVLGGTLPAEIDLRTTYETVAYGATANDNTAVWVLAGHVNSDQLPDIACSVSGGDGPSDSRTNCGETHVVYGSAQFPALIDFANGDGDLTIYGKAAGEKCTLKGLADLNDDGFDEVIVAAWLDSTSIRSETRLVSPFDSDGDGIRQLSDNCPLVSNAMQLDSNGDQRGDACQTDWDGDTLVDGADCAPANAQGGTPGEPTSVRFQPGSKTTLTWNAAPFAQRYEVTKGNPAQFASSNYGTCVTSADPNPADLTFVDSAVPTAGSSFSYLVSGRNTICAISGTLGTRSNGSPRCNSGPGACTP